MTRDFILGSLNVRANSDGTFSGYGSTFGNVDSYGDVVRPGAFKKSLAQWAVKGRLPPLLWQHDLTEVIGAWTVMREDSKGLYCEGRLSDTTRGRDARTLMRDGALSGLSIGFTLDRADARSDGGRDLAEITLWEVSIVTIPANDDARVTVVKSRGSHRPSVRAQIDSLLARSAFNVQRSRWALSCLGVQVVCLEAHLIQTNPALALALRLQHQTAVLESQVRSRQML